MYCEQLHQPWTPTNRDILGRSGSGSTDHHNNSSFNNGGGNGNNDDCTGCGGNPRSFYYESLEVGDGFLKNEILPQLENQVLKENNEINAGYFANKSPESEDNLKFAKGVFSSEGNSVPAYLLDPATVGFTYQTFGWIQMPAKADNEVVHISVGDPSAMPAAGLSGDYTGAAIARSYDRSTKKWPLS